MTEITTFRLRPGVEEAAFVAADARAQTDFFYQQPGIARRTLAKGVNDTGEWCTVTLWWTLADAENAEAVSTVNVAYTAMTSFIDETSISVSRFEELPG